MLSSDKKPTDNFDAEKSNTDMEVIELCVDEQAHVAGGTLGPFKAVGSPSPWDIASSGKTKGGSIVLGYDIALNTTE
jgi:hypothetical protein